MLFIAHLCNHIPLQVVVGLGAQLCNLLEGWVLVVGMSTIGHKQLCTPRIGDPQVPMVLKHGNIVGTQCCDKTSRASSDLTTSPL